METLNDQDFNLIEDFILGELSPEKETLFRERLETDTNLAKAYRSRIKMEQFWNEAGTYESTRKLVRKQCLLCQKKEDSRKKRIILYSVAASIILLIAIPFFYLRHTHNPTSILTNDADTSKKKPSSSFINEQPVKALQYIIPEYSIIDTLIIYRPKDFKARGIIYITCQTCNVIPEKAHFESGFDSLLIPLNGFIPGKYQWELKGTTIIGEFIVKDNDN